MFIKIILEEFTYLFYCGPLSSTLVMHWKRVTIAYCLLGRARAPFIIIIITKFV